MKKVLCSIVMLLISSFVVSVEIAAEEDLVALTQAKGYAVTAEVAPKAAMVVNAENGQVVWANNVDANYDPASLTKMLVAYMIFEAIEQGKFTLDTPVVATETDQAISAIYALSNNNIVAGESYTVRELLSATMVASSNVATLMLSHLLTTDDAAFLQQMDAKAKEIGMTSTSFTNATGAEASSFEGYYAPVGYDTTAPNSSTAKDIAILAYRLLQRFPQILEFTSQRQVTIKAGTAYEQVLTTYNHSLPGDSLALEGVDGLKTGSSPTAGYNTVVTAARGDVRLIVVILGASYWDDPNGEFVRHYFANALLEQLFAEYHRQIVAAAGQVTVGDQTVQIATDLYGLVKEGQEPVLEIKNNRLLLAGSIDESSGVALVAEQSKSASSSSLFTLATIQKQLNLKKNGNYYLYGVAGIILSLEAVRVLLLKHNPNKTRRIKKRGLFKRRKQEVEK